MGEAMNFTASVRNDSIPQDSGSFVESIKVADVSADDVAALHNIITNIPVQNDVQGWSCQDYIMEGLDALHEEQIVDDEDFEAVRPRLMRRYNH